MLPSWARTEVKVRRAPLVPSRGTKVRDWSQASEHAVTGCSFQPTGTSTDFDTIRQALTISAYLYAPPGVDIEEGDLVEVAGARFAVNGAPLPWESPTGAVSHLQVALIDWRE